jgi:hypothetical protein
MSFEWVAQEVVAQLQKVGQVFLRVGDVFLVAQWDMQARLMRISDDARANGQVLDQPVCEWAFSWEVDADPRAGDIPQVLGLHYQL